MKKIVYFFPFVLLTCLACTDRDREYFSVPQRTVLIYMAADNNLYKNAQSDIKEMLTAEIPENNHLLVYLDVPKLIDDESPELLEIKKGEFTVVKHYGQQNSASGEVLSTVIRDVITEFSAESYGLILWSHGTGWLPEGVFDNLSNQKKVYSFGKDGNDEMSIMELAESITVDFEYIIFDACLMGGIEVFYQLRNKANIIIASPTETLVAGFPYNEIIPFLFTPVPSYAEIAQNYMNHYKNKAGSLQSASLTVVETQQLEELANILRETAREDMVPPDRESVQKYDMREHVVFYDLQDYLSQAIQNPNRVTLLKQQIARTVKYHDYTPYFLEKLAIERSCGISVYVSSFIDSHLDSQYRQLDWYIDSHLLLSY
jgi:hypothetical protein